MYTAVLVLAMTAGTDSVEFGRRGRCSGCCSSYASCCSTYARPVYSSGCCSTYARPVYSGCCSSGGSVVPVVPKGEKIPQPGKVMINLPADARLSFNDAPTQSTGQQRSFVTPRLEYGKTYTYSVRAEFMSDGQPTTQTREVTVRAGETTVVQFNPPVSGITSR